MAESNPCGQCCFIGRLATECEFEFWRQWRSSMWVPRDCPKGIPRDANWKEAQRRVRRKYVRRLMQPKPPSEFELSVLAALRSYSGNFGLRHQHVVNMLNGRSHRRRSFKFVNVNTSKRVLHSLRILRAKGFVRSKNGRWFPVEALA